MKTMKLDLFQDKGKRWRWHLKASNGLIVADSGYSYARRSAALRAWDHIAVHVALDKVTVVG